MGAVDLELDELVPVDPYRPGGVDLRDDAALQFEDPVGGVVGGGRVRFALLVPAARDVCGDVCRDGVDLAEQLVQDVLPVREHVDGDAAAVLGPVVPGGALRFLPVAFEDPVAELASHGEDLAEEAAVDESLQLQQAGKEDLVLDDTVLDAGALREAGQIEGAFEVGRRRLLRVDVLSGGNGFLDGFDPRGSHLRVEVDVDGVVGEDGVQVGGPLCEAVPLRDFSEGVFTAADEDGLGPEHLAVAEVQSALFADREDGAHQVLPVSHPPRDAVHGDPHCPACHEVPSIRP